jgi:hypothetical protein
MERRLITSDEAKPSAKPLTKACSDCPWARKSLSGWLGGLSAKVWLQRAHTETLVPCHTTGNQQCAGLAIYRRNVCKQVSPPLQELPRDEVKVFASPMEFLQHHAPDKVEGFNLWGPE